MGDPLDRVAHMPPTAYTYEVRPVAAPAVGTDFQITVNDGGVWRVHAIVATLTASAVAGNRFPQLRIDDQSTRSMLLPAGAATIANGVTTYSWLLGFPVTMAAAEGGLVVAPLVEHVLHQGWRFGPVTVARDAGDQWSNVSITIERILTPPHTITQRLVDAIEYDDELQSIAAAGGFPQ